MSFKLLYSLGVCTYTPRRLKRAQSQTLWPSAGADYLTQKAGGFKAFFTEDYRKALALFFLLLEWMFYDI
ncbi:hypothetical protein HMF8227_00539 [Saliniradius amylolyticus]|uniref:Uncharacterized protein n=1 Tax=Saliniradius amylolyticus TaxID=2183582 RepID=A0A2S2E054_9ALTE|nr:hypothetical protein [Saliniradius amylolyticus]AWL11035.1 hypothetical protein HMF8227_00539 [Saliniradius amylolyticus]